MYSTKSELIQNQCSSNVITVAHSNIDAEFTHIVIHCITVWYKLRMVKGNARRLKLISNIPQNVIVKQYYILIL